MTRFENDPRLTAYALGELDVAEAAEIEATLAGDSAARAAVGSIRAAAERLSASLAIEPTPALDDFRRADLASAVRTTPIRARSASEGLSRDDEPAPAGSETLACASGSDSLSAEPAVVPTMRILRPWWINTSAAAAAVLLVGIGFVALGPERPVVVPGLEVGGGTDVLGVSTGLKVSKHLAPVRMDNLTRPGGDDNARKDIDGDATPSDQFAVERAAGNSPGTVIGRSRSGKLTDGSQVTTGEESAPLAELIPGDDYVAMKRFVYSASKARGQDSQAFPESFPQQYYVSQAPRNHFDFERYISLSYGYQVPFGVRAKPNQKMDVRMALNADRGPYYRAGTEAYPQHYYIGTPEAGDKLALGRSFARYRLQSTGYAAGVEVAESGTGFDLTASSDGGGTAHSMLFMDFMPEGFYGPKAPPPSSGVISGSSVVLKLSQLGAADVQAILDSLERSSLETDLWADLTIAEDIIRLPEGAYDPDALIDFAFGLPFTDAYGIDLNGAASESYGPVHHNPFLLSSSNPLSTFSIDVDTASYANVRRFLLSGQLPPPPAVRIEECLNYFTYDYPIPAPPVESSETWLPTAAAMPPATPPPFSANMEVAACPWEPKHRLVRIGLRGWEPAEEDRPTANLVFLVDVSGSMQPENRLLLVIQSLKLLVERLRDDDRIAIAVYAGASGMALPSTPIRERAAIVTALDNLSAGGSTNGGEGINLAYSLGAQNFIAGGINRVILCTDGDFNVGIADRNELQTLIETKAKSGVFLSVLGFGMGNLKDATLETLADRGNGNYAYIDSLDEARKVLVDQMGGTLQTIAKDVKIQVEFNPAAVGAYRLLGYENRMLAAQDFNDDTKDAGEIGAGHTVTALYEVVPVGVAVPEMPTDAASREGIPAGGGARRDSRTSDTQTLVRASGSDFIVVTLNDVVPPPPTPIELEAETPEFLAPDPAIDPLKYQTPDELIAAQSGGPLELLTLKLRYKEPDGEESKKLEFVLDDAASAFDDASPDFRFAAAVAGFAMNLRGTPHIAGWPLAAIAETALSAMGEDADRHRAEFLSLVKQAQVLKDESAK